LFNLRRIGNPPVRTWRAGRKHRLARCAFPMHGKGHELPRGTVIGIEKALRLK